MKQKVQNLKSALAIGGIGVDEAIAEQVILTVARLEEKGDQFTVRDASEIKAEVHEKYNPKEEQ